MADIRTLALTDHHAIAAYAEAQPAAHRYGVCLMPAVELDCVADGNRVDLLGYGIDPDSAAIRHFLDRWPSASRQLLDDPIELPAMANGLGIPDLRERILAAAGERAPSIAALVLVLVETGWAPTIGAAYVRLRTWRREQHLPRLPLRFAPAAEAAAAIRAAGGVVSLAHPSLVRNDDIVERLLATGTVDAIEGLYGGYWQDGDEKNRRYTALGQVYGLPISAGSDYHAYPFDRVRMGIDAPHGTLRALMARRRLPA